MRPFAVTLDVMLLVALVGCEAGPSYTEQWEADRQQRDQAVRERIQRTPINEFRDFLKLENAIDWFWVADDDEMHALLDTRRRQWYVEHHPELPVVTLELIREGKIVIGMTAEHVQASRGWPNKINRSVGSWGVHSQWVYEEGGGIYTLPDVTYLYLENGVLTSWQD